LLTAGIALILLAACYELIDVRKRREFGRPFEILGMNAILVFVASVLMIKTLVKTKIGAGEDAPTTYAWINEHLFQSWAGVLNGSLIFAILTVLLWLAVAYGLYRQRWFLKI
jgi:predicted acyltransferase